MQNLDWHGYTLEIRDDGFLWYGDDAVDFIALGGGNRFRDMFRFRDDVFLRADAGCYLFSGTNPNDFVLQLLPQHESDAILAAAPRG